VVAPYFCFVLISRVVVGLSVFCTELLDLQFRGGGSSCKFGGDDEKKNQFYCNLCRIFLHFCWSAV